MASNKMKITVKETSIVRPAKDPPKINLWNSSLDLLVPRIHVPTVYFYRPNGSSNFFDVGILKKALSEVTVAFYPVAGRLGKDENGRIEIQCKAEGVLFIEAETSCFIDDFGDFTPCSDMLQLVPSIHHSTDISSYPLFAAQVTSFECGGICLGVSWHHILGDGTSATQFINSWAATAHGIPITIPPFIDRTLLKANVPPNPTFDRTEYGPPLSMMNNTVSAQNSNLTTTKIITITPDQIRTLKLKSRKDDNAANYSTFETLAAHIWRCICMACDLPNDQPTKLYIPTTGRSRLRPPVPLGFFGNVHFTTTVTAVSGEIRSNPLVYTIEKIHEALKRMDDEYLRSTIDYLQVQTDLTALIRGSHTYRSPNFNITSWTRFAVNDADFGWGRPVFMGPASVVFEGTIIVMQSPVNDGSLSMIMCLETQHMLSFQKLFYEFIS